MSLGPPKWFMKFQVPSASRSGEILKDRRRRRRRTGKSRGHSRPSGFRGRPGTRRPGGRRGGGRTQRGRQSGRRASSPEECFPEDPATQMMIDLPRLR